jgi:site-specific recombinase XerC
MTTVMETTNKFFFFLEHTRKVTPGTLLTYKQTIKEFCSMYGMKDTKNLIPTYIIRFRNTLLEKKCVRKPGKSLEPSTVYVTMIRLKSYIKWLGES